MTEKCVNIDVLKNFKYIFFLKERVSENIFTRRGGIDMILQSSGRTCDIATALCMPINHFLSLDKGWEMYGEDGKKYLSEAVTFMKMLCQCKLNDKSLSKAVCFYKTPENSKTIYVSDFDSMAKIAMFYSNPYDFYDAVFTSIIEMVPIEKERASHDPETWLVIEQK